MREGCFGYPYAGMRYHVRCDDAFYVEREEAKC